MSVFLIESSGCSLHALENASSYKEFLTLLLKQSLINGLRFKLFDWQTVHGMYFLGYFD